MNVVLCIADVKNGNNRIYPKEELERAIRKWKEEGALPLAVVKTPQDGLKLPISLDSTIGFATDFRMEENKLFGTLSEAAAKEVYEEGEDAEAARLMSMATVSHVGENLMILEDIRFNGVSVGAVDVMSELKKDD